MILACKVNGSIRYENKLIIYIYNESSNFVNCKNEERNDGWSFVLITLLVKTFDFQARKIN